MHCPCGESVLVQPCNLIGEEIFDLHDRERDSVTVPEVYCVLLDPALGKVNINVV